VTALDHCAPACILTLQAKSCTTVIYVITIPLSSSTPAWRSRTRDCDSRHISSSAPSRFLPFIRRPGVCHLTIAANYRFPCGGRGNFQFISTVVLAMYELEKVKYQRYICIDLKSLPARTRIFYMFLQMLRLSCANMGMRPTSLLNHCGLAGGGSGDN
jgi:hypothetical protein